MIIKNVEATILGLGVDNARLLPGNNTLSDETWKKAKKNIVIKHRIESGLLVEIKQETKTDSFAEMTAKDQKKFVSDLNDLDKLNSYLRHVKSDAVRKAIESQIKKIEEA